MFIAIALVFIVMFFATRASTLARAHYFLEVRPS
jgi:hypothetical protein